MHRFRKVWALGLAVALTACIPAQGVRYPLTPTDGPWVLVHGNAPDPDGKALLADLYAGVTPWPALRVRTATVLQKHPDSLGAHEVAAELAGLDGDSHAAWWHWLHAALHLDGPSELYLARLPSQLTAGETTATVSALQRLAAATKRPDARAAALVRLSNLAELQGDVKTALAQRRSLGAIGDWSIIGPFDNDQGKGFLNAYPPEAGIALDAEMPGSIINIKWRAITDTVDVPLSELVAPSDASVAYLATWVFSPTRQRAWLRLSTADPVRAWCNDALVLSEELLRGGDFDNIAASVDLLPGWNKLLVKSANRAGRWTLFARLTDLAGAPLVLHATAGSHPTERAKTAGPMEVRHLPPAIDVLDGDDRQRYWRGALLSAAGQHRAAEEEHTRLLTDHANSALAQLRAALSYWENDEQGKAVDLVNQAVKATNGAEAGVLALRARFYMQKRLFDKAGKDLAAARALPFARRGVELQLAELFALRGWTIDRCHVLDGVVTRWPDDARSHFERAACLETLDYESVDDELARAASLMPGDERVLWRQVRRAERKGRFGRAASLLTELRRLSPRSPEVVLALADVARRDGRTADAEALMTRAAEMTPGLGRPHARLGDLHYEAGHTDAATAEWRLALERDPNDAALAERLEFHQPVKLGLAERFVPTDEDIDRALRLDIPPKRGAQVVLLLDHEVTEINADGGAKRVVTQVSHIVSVEGRDSMIKQDLPRRGQLKILHVYSINKRGERQEASSVRGSEVRFRALEVGSKIVLQYVHYRPAGGFLPNRFVDNWYFSGVHMQHQDARWVVIAPAARPLLVHVAGTLERNERVDGDRRIYTFSAHDIAPIVPEAAMPPLADIIMRVSVSSVPSWDEYVRWERALLTDAFVDSPELAQLAKKLVGDATTPREKLDRLFRYTAQEIRYQQDYETTIAGVRPHASSTVMERAYGDCKDKAVLLIQLLRQVNLQADFAILRTTSAGRVDREVPNQQFNHAIVYVPEQPGFDQGFFVDPTATDLDVGSLRADDQGATSLVLDRRAGTWQFRDIPYESPAGQLESHAIHIDLRSPTEARAVDQVTVHGTTGTMLRHLLRNSGQAQKVLQGLAASLLPGSTLDKWSAENDGDIWKPVSLKLELDVANAVQVQGERLRITPPGVFSLRQVTTLSQRETPLWLGPPDRHVYDVDADLPEGYVASHIPTSFEVTHPCFTVARQSTQSGRKVAVHLAIERRCTSLPVADYPAFRESVQKVVKQFQDEIVFEKPAVATPTSPKKKGK